MTPEIVALKTLIAKIKPDIYIDLHSHSRALGSFFYSCPHIGNEGFSSWTKVRLLPKIMAQISGPLFDYNKCRFKIQKGKEGTGRVVAWRQF